MEMSKLGIITKKITNLDNQYPIQDMLIQTGQIMPLSSGIYAYSNIPLLLSEKISGVIRKNLDSIGCVLVSLPLLQPEKIWEKSGRLKRYVDDDIIFRCQSKKGNFCLAPTAEEAMVTYAKDRLTSHKNLPITFYQIGPKFRNEIRTRGYLLRGKSFEMMDAYSFGRNKEDLNNQYNQIKNNYYKIFKELGIDIFPVIADNGSIGGSRSEEFMCRTSFGEDTVFFDETQNRAFNKEVFENSKILQELNISSYKDLKEEKALELGHIFQLGDKYSRSMNATYIDSNSKNEYYVMGCYGIGTSRTLALIYENSIIKSDNGKFDGIALPYNLSPYTIALIPKMDETKKYITALEIYQQLMENNVPILFDDRENLSIGSKIKDIKLTGVPYLAILGKTLDDGYIEIENIKTKEKTKVALDNFIDLLISYQKDMKYNIPMEQSICKKKTLN